jgi:hypothetical protein
LIRANKDARNALPGLEQLKDGLQKDLVQARKDVEQLKIVPAALMALGQANRSASSRSGLLPMTPTRTDAVAPETNAQQHGNPSRLGRKPIGEDPRAVRAAACATHGRTAVKSAQFRNSVAVLLFGCS